MEADLRLYRHEDGTLAKDWAYLHARTQGRMSSLSALIRGAAQLAILEGREAVDCEMLGGIALDQASEHAYQRTQKNTRKRKPAARNIA
jgi:hypothetical protein